MTIARIRGTSNNKLAAFLRLTLAVLFLMTGAMKLLFVVRLAGLLVVGLMIVAAYVHLVVDDLSLFPLKPSAPVIPLAVIAVSAYLVWRGAGAWSLDLRAALRPTSPRR
jgi:uncharacterized membrane protein YphA (DoxX/SURF4 family)